jgi:FkbM family methyltransferase
MGESDPVAVEEVPMLIPFDDLHDKYNFNIGGLLHVGAHEGQEAPMYKKLGFNPVFWVEAETETFNTLEKNLEAHPGHVAIQAVVADEIKTVTFHHANNGQSSSILELGTHAKEHPEVVYTGERERMATTIETLFELGLIEQCNFLNLDIQGAELMALQGAHGYLAGVDYIYTEVNIKPLYKGCALLKDLDSWLGSRGFERVEIMMTRHGWGDALYVRQP